VAEAMDLDVILTDTEVEALLLEATLIRQHRPHYNILLKDDKSFPYVRVSVQEEFPRLSVTRHVRGDGARYLGPYTDVKNLRRTLRQVRRIFPLRTCRNFEDYRRANRPCLYYHIRRCVVPATGAPQSPEDYGRWSTGRWFSSRAATSCSPDCARDGGRQPGANTRCRAAPRSDPAAEGRVCRRMVTRRALADAWLTPGPRGGGVLLVRGGRVGKESRLDGRGARRTRRCWALQPAPPGPGSCPRIVVGRAGRGAGEASRRADAG
jgi:hypothetical protein